MEIQSVGDFWVIYSFGKYLLAMCHCSCLILGTKMNKARKTQKHNPSDKIHDG